MLEYSTFICFWIFHLHPCHENKSVAKAFSNEMLSTNKCKAGVKLHRKVKMVFLQEGVKFKGIWIPKQAKLMIRIEIWTSYNIKNSRKNEIRLTASFWFVFEERARLFKVWKSFRNKAVLPVKRISYFLHFLMLYVLLIILCYFYCFAYFFVVSARSFCKSNFPATKNAQIACKSTRFLFTNIHLKETK